jgi:hypothetical protein
MTILQSELNIYPALLSPFDDSSPTGGGIDTSARLMGSILEATEKLEILSDGSVDQRVVTVHGITYGGEYRREDFQLDGFAPIQGKIEFYRILEVSALSSPLAFIVRKQSNSSVILTVAAGIVKYTTVFKRAFPFGGSVPRYEKVFLRNDNLSESLTDASILVIAGSSASLTFASAVSLDDTEQVVNRLAAPSGLTFAATTTLELPEEDLEAGEAIGVWIKQAQDSQDIPTLASAKPRMVLVGGTT